MKKLIAICIFFAAVIGYSQDKQPTFEAEGDLVKATYYNEDGAIETQGYFKNKKLTGEWTRFDKEGNKTQLAYYDNGKKVGKWFVWTQESLKEINYNNNVVVNVNLWKQEGKLAINK
jgi:antitoxin component YwqK of YwqJK toxin-antitoxin module